MSRFRVDIVLCHCIIKLMKYIKKRGVSDKVRAKEKRQLLSFAPFDALQGLLQLKVHWLSLSYITKAILNGRKTVIKSDTEKIINFAHL